MDLERLSLRDNKSSLDEEGSDPCLPSQKIDLERPFPMAHYDSLLGSTWLEISPAGEELGNSNSQNMELERQKPWAMAYEPSLNKRESLPDPPSCPIKVDSIFSAAGEFPNPCIVVGDDLSLVGYDLLTTKWFACNFPIHDHGERFGVRDVDTPPRLAHLGGDKSCLLWVSVLPHKCMKISKSKEARASSTRREQ
ncbi:hypothetical protein LOK49_LG07G00177 [Camellia lanceoleosa]|uniref:Uncharacterized protein n=1 Tax=Camellia lanceoleosa TaxID=1840588 RepID=A0ACC0GZ33_9ERIC|nr:hypothetical protein LOK49_LG07G00177 [Camellia lanceoleosa]